MKNKAPHCPHCKKEMRLVNGQHGDFFGCVMFPKCKFISKTRVIGYSHPKEFRDSQILHGSYESNFK